MVIVIFTRAFSIKLKFKYYIRVLFHAELPFLKFEMQMNAIRNSKFEIRNSNIKAAKPQSRKAAKPRRYVCGLRILGPLVGNLALVLGTLVLTLGPLTKMLARG